MRVSFTFRNLDSSEALKNYATEKIAKIQKYLRAPLEAEVTASVERHLQRIDVVVSSGGKRYAGTEESDDMYASIDLAMDKIEGQVRRSKSTETSRMRSGGVAVMTKKSRGG
jgi:putative sigma-54 modulation protein